MHVYICVYYIYNTHIYTYKYICVYIIHTHTENTYTHTPVHTHPVGSVSRRDLF